MGKGGRKPSFFSQGMNAEAIYPGRPFISHRYFRFCRHHTSINRTVYLRCAMFRPSVTGVATYHGVC